MVRPTRLHDSRIMGFDWTSWEPMWGAMGNLIEFHGVTQKMSPPCNKCNAQSSATVSWYFMWNILRKSTECPRKSVEKMKSIFEVHSTMHVSQFTYIRPPWNSMKSFIKKKDGSVRNISRGRVQSIFFPMEPNRRSNEA